MPFLRFVILLLVCICPATWAVSTQVTQLNVVSALQKQSSVDPDGQAEVPSSDYAYQDSFERDTPRGSIRGFIRAAYQHDYERAAMYLDLRNLPPSMNRADAALYAKQLQAIIERNVWIDFGNINDTTDGEANDNLPSARDSVGHMWVNGAEVSLLVQKVPAEHGGLVWKLSASTVAQVPRLYEQLGYGPVVEWFIEHVPAGHLFKLNLWEWALLVAYLLVAFAIVVPITWVIKWGVMRSNYSLKLELAAIVTGPLRFCLAVALDRAALANSTLSALATELVNSGMLFILSIVWLVWAVIGLMQSTLREHWIAKGNKQAASLLRPLGNFVRVVMLALAILVWLEHLGFNAGTILAGMGIGGIAIALASKQSIENLIGTITLYSAAPIKVGNLCNFGGMRGTVEEIGLRCTRIRTIDRSVIHVPNAKLAEMEIENISEREKIRFKTDVRLDYHTTAEQIRAITADIKALFEAHEKVNEKPLRVTFKGFGLHGLEINVFAYIGTTSLPTYQLVAEELQLGIMEIVAKNGSRIVPVMPYIAQD